jgi:hypothetical protein
LFCPRTIIRKDDLSCYHSLFLRNLMHFPCRLKCISISPSLV